MSRSFIIALQFLTRLPTPSLKALATNELSDSARWFPAVGAIVGLCVCAAALAGNQIHPWLGGLLGIGIWIWVTGALHLDGLADLTDALGASHRDPERFLSVLRDPHIGTFGAVALVLAILGKFVLIAIGLQDPDSLALAVILIPAWARFGAMVCAAQLPALTEGSAERFSWRISRSSLVFWGAGLMIVSALWLPTLLIAPLLLAAWTFYLHKRLGGMTGDCLGAGIEIIEIALLLAVIVNQSWAMLPRAWP